MDGAQSVMPNIEPVRRQEFIVSTPISCEGPALESARDGGTIIPTTHVSCADNTPTPFGPKEILVRCGGCSGAFWMDSEN